MNDDQHIEWKASRRDEYLRWICGFANADGGVLHIGRNDKDAVAGVSDATKLMRDIPNKVRDILGIVVKTNLRTKDGREYIGIRVGIQALVSSLFDRYASIFPRRGKPMAKGDVPVGNDKGEPRVRQFSSDVKYINAGLRRMPRNAGSMNSIPDQNGIRTTRRTSAHSAPSVVVNGNTDARE